MNTVTNSLIVYLFIEIMTHLNRKNGLGRARFVACLELLIVVVVCFLFDLIGNKRPFISPEI